MWDWVWGEVEWGGMGWGWGKKKGGKGDPNSIP